MHTKISELSLKRIKHLLVNDNNFYEGHKTYVDGLRDELVEAEEEIKSNNSVHLEDELGDVFWNYICLLHALEKEGKITSLEKVFDRGYEKYSGRISEDGTNNGDWTEVKNKQKEELKIEHNRLYKDVKKVK